MPSEVGLSIVDRGSIKISRAPDLVSTAHKFTRLGNGPNEILFADPSA
jgi:hypothetical protein